MAAPICIQFNEISLSLKHSKWKATQGRKLVPDLFGPLPQSSAKNWMMGRGDSVAGSPLLFLHKDETVRMLERNGGQMTTRLNSAGRKDSNSKTKRLNSEAFKVVEEQAHEIAQALMKSTKKGKVMSTRLLVELAGGNMTVEEAPTGPLRSLALELAAQPQMPAESLTPDDVQLKGQQRKV